MRFRSQKTKATEKPTPAPTVLSPRSFRWVWLRTVRSVECLRYDGFQPKRRLFLQHNRRVAQVLRRISRHPVRRCDPIAALGFDVGGTVSHEVISLPLGKWRLERFVRPAKNGLELCPGNLRR